MYLSHGFSHFCLCQIQQPSGVLVEHNKNDLLLHSPDQVGSKADRLLSSSSRTPRKQQSRSLAAASERGISNHLSSGNPCAHFRSPTLCGKKNESHSVAVTCTQSVPSSAPLETTGHNVRNDAGVETFSM